MDQLLYEKIEKSADNLYGFKEIENGRNPFLEGPCLLNIAAIKNNERDLAGIIKEGMKMARYRVRGQQNAGFKLNDSPISFLSIHDMNDKEFQDFLDTYMFPLISNNNQKIDFIQASKNIRNVNIMSYCDGAIDAQKIESALIQKMTAIRLYSK
jgi:hypothetical protein